MGQRIEDYAMIGDCHSVALVGRDGSIDWLCLPRFDSGACFAALLGEPNHGRWLLAPENGVSSIKRFYRKDTLILETVFETDSGTVSLVDFMVPRTSEPDLVRLVVGREGQVRMKTELILRFDYGAIVPWVRSLGGGISAIGGPDSLRIRTPVPLRGEGITTVAEFTVSKGEEVPFSLQWYPSHCPPPVEIDAKSAIADTEQWWKKWLEKCPYEGEWREAIVRSLITLKALTYAPTGGIVAAPTTSLPESIGGGRNWDYRYCWLRDATFSLYALMISGFEDEARRWREWLLRTVAGDPKDLRIMYGLGGERRLPELMLEWLPGYERSFPVRIGNAASNQFQLDVFGEVMDSFHYGRKVGLEPDDEAWKVQQVLLDFLESKWEEPDEGIWEIRGPRRHFTHSKVMAWVAFDRAVKAIERYGLEGPLERWQELRVQVAREVCQKGFNPELNSFVQFYGSKELDASLLMLPLLGFIHASDPRMQGTVESIKRELSRDGLIMRYSEKNDIDGLADGEGVFLICSFWLADNYAIMGRKEEAQDIFERLLSLRNDVGLLSEEYDPNEKRMLGNFPQAFSHVALINTAHNLTETIDKSTKDRID